MSLSNIFFIFILSSCLSVHAAAIENCQDHISSIVCLVDSPLKESDRYKDGRQCLSGSDKYAEPILDAYKAFPSFVQKTLCSLKKIYIEKSFFGPAWSGLADDNDPTSGIIGIRQKELDAKISAELYQSWYEQQSFGLKDNFEVVPDLPLVTILPLQRFKLRGYVYTILHEIGHILDYQRKFNDSECVKDCIPNPQNWTAISWISTQVPKPSSDFKLRSSICLNNCQGKFISASDANELYTSIYQHGFVSQLAALNSMEDFAESFAVFISSKYMNLHFGIYLKSGESYQLDEVLKSKEFKEKLKFLTSQFHD